MPPRAFPFLTFQPTGGPGAAEAMEVYTGLFGDGEILTVRRRDDATVEFAEFVVAGLHVRCSDSPPVHEWTFTPAVSLFVDCETVADQRRIFGALSDGGAVFMPLDDYGFGPFGWIQDRFGVSWQLAAPPE